MSMSKPKTAEMQRFDGALRSVLQVSKSDLQKMLENERLEQDREAEAGPKA